jgi:CTP:phosphocholine cytidylyltransferase-like protein
MTPSYNIQQLIDHSKVTVKEENKKWNELLVNHHVLKEKVDYIKDKFGMIQTQNDNNHHLNNHSLKMARQDDIRNQIEHDNNIAIFSGIGMTIVLITALLIYIN